MRTKIFITIILIFGVLFLINFLSGRYLASRVDQQLQQIADTDDRISYEYSSLKVNPAFGSLTINDLSFYGEDDTYEAERIRGSLTYADIWRIIRNRSDHPLSNIRSFQVTVNALQAGSATTVRTVNLLYSGRMDELVTLTLDDQAPRYDHRITLTLLDISNSGAAPGHSGLLPVLQYLHLPEHINQFNTQLHYRAGEQRIALNNLRLKSPELVLTANGELRYGESGWPLSPENITLDYELDASTRDLAKLPLSNTLGGFSMDTLSVHSRFRLDDIAAFGNRHPLTYPGETTLYLGNIHWYPPDQLIEQYGLLFGMLDISEERLPVRNFRTHYRNTGDTLRINESTLSTEPFDAAIQALVHTPADQRPEILNGSITFVRTGAAFNDFVDGVEGLFAIELPRRDGQLHFEFSGDPGSPDFDLNLDR